MIIYKLQLNFKVLVSYGILNLGSIFQGFKIPYDTSIQNSSLMNYYLLVATVSCLIFYYHMNGADIGKLGVYVHERDASLGTAALEITGDQGNQWNQGKVQLDFSTFYDPVVSIEYLSKYFLGIPHFILVSLSRNIS